MSKVEWQVMSYACPEHIEGVEWRKMAALPRRTPKPPWPSWRDAWLGDCAPSLQAAPDGRGRGPCRRKHSIRFCGHKSESSVTVRPKAL